jgi:hypothetical protein
MSTETKINAADFDFGGCFCPNPNNPGEEIYNVTLVCAIMLILFGSFKGACNGQQLMNSVVGIAKRNTPARSKINDVREALGDLYYNVNESKLAATGGTDDIQPVNRVEQLYYYDPEKIHEFSLLPFLLAYFNLPNTMKSGCGAAVSNYIRNNNLLCTILNIMSAKFQPNSTITPYKRGMCYILPFEGMNSDDNDVHTHNIKVLNIQSEDLDEGNVQVIAGFLTAIQTAVDIPAPVTNRTPLIAPVVINRCGNLKKILKNPYTAFFVIAVAALLASGAIALTTYFHVGTSLMLAAGFIPFLNFVGGFQISLLLGVVSVATLGAGGIYAIIKKTKCCDECCNSEPVSVKDYYDK